MDENFLTAPPGFNPACAGSPFIISGLRLNARLARERVTSGDKEKWQLVCTHEAGSEAGEVAGGKNGLAQLENLERDVIRTATAFCQLD
jgi:hypothetical protein